MKLFERLPSFTGPSKKKTTKTAPYSFYICKDKTIEADGCRADPWTNYCSGGDRLQDGEGADEAGGQLLELVWRGGSQAESHSLLPSQYVGTRVQC